MIPFRLKILKRLTQSLEEIVYEEIPMSGRVFRGKQLYGFDDPVPMLSILESAIPVEGLRQDTDSPNVSEKWELIVQGTAPVDTKNPSDSANILMALVKQKLASLKVLGYDRRSDILGLGKKSENGNSIVSMNIGSGCVYSPEEPSELCFFLLLLTFTIAENLENPFEEE